MQIRKGNGRYALIVPLLGLVFKFPRIRIRYLIKEPLLMILLFIKEKNRRKPIIHSLTTGWHDTESIWYLLFHGILENRKEFAFYRDTKNKVAWPTLFSFFGIINIQRIALPVQQKDREWLFTRVLDVAMGDLRDMHCFGNDDNWGVDLGGNIFLLDYASDNSHKVLKNHEEALRKILKTSP
jgi:hypothetical protein